MRAVASRPQTMRISSALGCRRLPRAASPSARPDVGIGTRFMKSCIFAFRLWRVCGRALVLLLCGSCGLFGCCVFSGFSVLAVPVFLALLIVPATSVVLQLSPFANPAGLRFLRYS